MEQDSLSFPSLDQMASIVDHRTEEPNVEYKTWMDLSSSDSKSKLAKHLAALANYGGGWLVFGIDDDGAHSEPHPGQLAGYSQDTINNIVSKYLDPAFHCNVYFVASSKTNKQYPVVRVPSHGAQPICAKADGPLVDRKRVGVTRGVHYVRVPGPKSVPIDSPELWRTVLHRCVVAERAQLLVSVGRLFEQPREVINTPSLDVFLDALIVRWNELQTNGWAVDPTQNRCAYAFQLLKHNGDEVEPISLSQLKEALRQSSGAASDQSDNAAPSFDPSNFGTSRPSVVLWDGDEGYECDAIHASGAYLLAPALWRATVRGIGAEVRPYHEDTEWVRSAVEDRSSITWPIGECLSPRFQVNRAFQFLAFVRHFAPTFLEAERVRLMADFSGLSGRELKETRIGWSSFSRRISSTANRRVRLETSIESLLGNGYSNVTSEFLNGVFRLFDGWEINRDFVTKAVEARR